VSAGNSEELASLRLGYVRSLPGHLLCLRAAVRAWSRAPADGALLARAESLAHRLRGTSGSYGLQAFSTKVGAVEEELRRARAAGTPADEAMATIARDLREADELALEAMTILEAGSLGARGGTRTDSETFAEEDV
jgi:hypothetical protein